LDSFEAAVKDTAKAFFAEGLRETERTRRAIQEVQSVLDSLMGELSPAFSQTFDVLEDIRHFFQRHSGMPANQVGPVTGGLSKPTTQLASGTSPADLRVEPTIGNGIEQLAGPIGSRDQAIRQLQEIASFFRRTEPHSPVAYLAEKPPSGEPCRSTNGCARWSRTTAPCCAWRNCSVSRQKAAR
jgi:type VI secretion system protein ImpA